MTNTASSIQMTAKMTGKLSLGDVLRLLVNDGTVEKQSAEKLYKDRKLDSSSLHPLVVYVAD